MARKTPIRSITTGRGENVKGLKELEAKLKALDDASVGAEAQLVIRNALRPIFEAVVGNAQSVNIPHEAMQDIFMYGRQPERSRKKLSGLVGLRKRGRGTPPSAKGYVEWNPDARGAGTLARTPGAYLAKRYKGTFKKGLVTGRRIGENLATMWELGTSRMAARPFFRPAVESSKAAVIQQIADGYKAILDRAAT
jgi:HK97 gp10 family phage protein